MAKKDLLKKKISRREALSTGEKIGIAVWIIVAVVTLVVIILVVISGPPTREVTVPGAERTVTVEKTIPAAERTVTITQTITIPEWVNPNLLAALDRVKSFANRKNIQISPDGEEYFSTEGKRAVIVGTIKEPRELFEVITIFGGITVIEAEKRGIRIIEPDFIDEVWEEIISEPPARPPHTTPRIGESGIKDLLLILDGKDIILTRYPVLRTLLG